MLLVLIRSGSLGRCGSLGSYVRKYVFWKVAQLTVAQLTLYSLSILPVLVAQSHVRPTIDQSEGRRFDPSRVLQHSFVEIDHEVQSNLNSSNTDGSLTTANSNSFLSPYEILPIAPENKYSRKFSYFHEIVCCVYSLKSPHWGDLNEYTRRTIFV